MTPNEQICRIIYVAEAKQRTMRDLNLKINNDDKQFNDVVKSFIQNLESKIC